MGGLSNLAYSDVVTSELTGHVLQNNTLDAELRLFSAILERAARDYLGRNKSLCHQAARWLFADSPENAVGQPFSFSWICDALNLEPGPLQAGLQSLHAEGKNRRAVKALYRGGLNVRRRGVGLVDKRSSLFSA